MTMTGGMALHRLNNKNNYLATLYTQKFGNQPSQVQASAYSCWKGRRRMNALPNIVEMLSLPKLLERLHGVTIVGVNAR